MPAVPHQVRVELLEHFCKGQTSSMSPAIDRHMREYTMGRREDLGDP